MIQIHLDRIQIRDTTYQKLLNDCQQSGHLATVFQNAWNLNGAPLVSAIKFTVQESKDWRKGMVPIKVQSESVQIHNQLNNSKVQSESEALSNVELAPMPEVKTTPGLN
eukprot:494680_1